jgi:flavin reductase (DIM6/NTAB) family NADH-FMN oxidoreductase RutF
MGANVLAFDVPDTDAQGTTFSPRLFRNAMSQFCTGVVVVTGVSHGRPVGFAAQSFVSVSLAPPLISICPARSSTTWPLLRESGRFGINVLASDQLDLCSTFARSGGDKFTKCEWDVSSQGTPILGNIMGFVECELEAEYSAGDHTLVIGRVMGFDLPVANRSPLLFFRSGYGSFSSL